MFPDIIFKAASPTDELSNESSNGPPDSRFDGPSGELPEFYCVVCLDHGVVTPLSYGGRGRKPTKCDDHKTRTTPTGSRGGTGSRKRGVDIRITAVVEDLQKGAGMVAGGVAPIAPVTANTILLTSPGAIDSLVSIAARYPKMLEGLEIAAQAVPFLDVAKFMGGVVFAMSVDMGRMYPTGIAAEYLRVAEAAEMAGWTPPTVTDYTETPDGFNAPPPPRFKM